MSLVKANNGRGKVNSAKKGIGKLIVSGSNRAILFEFGKEVLDEMPCFVEVFVVLSGFFSVFLGRNDHFFSLRFQFVNDTLIGIVRFVSQQSVGFEIF